MPGLLRHLLSALGTPAPRYGGRHILETEFVYRSIRLNEVIQIHDTYS